MVFSRSSRRMAVTAGLALLTLAVASPSAAYLGDESIQMPPTSGSTAYGVFGPNQATFPKAGGTYVDPVPAFGSTVRRITGEFPKASNSDIYSRNGFWNADGTRMFHNTTSSKTIIDTATGATVRTGVPGNFDGSFAPDDPDTWYYLSGSSLMKYSVASGTSTTLKTFGAPLGGLGGSVDWIDNTGRYMVLSIGGTATVWDKQADVLYAGGISADVGGGWIGISPDGRYLVASADTGFSSYAIDHSARTLGAGVLFWTLCGGHADLVSASDGSTYLVAFDCYGSAIDTAMPPAVYAVNVARAVPVPNTDPLNPVHEANRNAQRDGNRKLFDLASWNDSDGHVSGVSRGLLRNWAFISIESSDDAFGLAVNSSWWNRPYMQEIVMVNVITGDVLRLGHHRSRGIGGSYYYQPRVSAGWGDCTKATVAWASNFGQLQLNKKGQPTRKPYPGYADIYAIDVAASQVPADGTVCP